MSIKLKTLVLLIVIFFVHHTIKAQSLIFIDQSKSVSEKYNDPQIKTKIENITKWFLSTDDKNAPKANLGNVDGFFIYESTANGAPWLSNISCDCPELVEGSPKKAIKKRKEQTDIYEKKVIDVLDSSLKSYEKKATDIWGAIKRISDYKAKNVFIVSDMIHCTSTDCIASLKDKTAAQKKGVADVAVALKRYSIISQNLENTRIWVYYPIGALEAGKKDIMKEYWNYFFWKLNPTIKVGFIE